MWCGTVARWSASLLQWLGLMWIACSWRVTIQTLLVAALVRLQPLLVLVIAQADALMCGKKPLMYFRDRMRKHSPPETVERSDPFDAGELTF